MMSTWEVLSTTTVCGVPVPVLEKLPVEGGFLYRTSTIHNGCYAGQQVVYVPCQVAPVKPDLIDPDPSSGHYERGSYDNDREWVHALCEPLGLDAGSDGREEIVAAVEKLVREWADMKLDPNTAKSQYR